MIEAIENWMILNRLPDGRFPKQGSYANAEWDADLVAAIAGQVPSEIEDMYIAAMTCCNMFGYCIIMLKNIQAGSNEVKRHYVNRPEINDDTWHLEEWPNELI